MHRHLIAIEALAAGLPVVASKVGGLGELTGDQVTLVEPENPRALAAAIDAALASPPQPAQAQNLVAARDWKNVASRLVPEW